MMKFIIVGARELDMFALSCTRDFHSVRAFVRKDVFRPPKLRGLQVPPVRRHRSLDGARTIVT